MVNELHAQERDLDLEEERVKLMKERRELKDKELQRKQDLFTKGVELIEKDENPPMIIPEVVGTKRDHATLEMIDLGWKEKVSEELVNEFHARCMMRLKKSNDMDWIVYAERFASVKMGKNPVTINKQASPDWLDCY